MAIFTLAGTAIATAIGLGATAASVISAGLAIGAQLALSYFTRQKQKPLTQDPRTAISGTVQFGADVGRWAVYGKAALYGHQQYYAAYGDGDKYNAEVFVLGDGWNDGLEPEVMFYGEKHTLVSATKTGSEDEHWKVSGFDDLISIRFYSGKPGQVADTKLVTDTANLDNPFTSTMKFTNQAYVVVERAYNQDKFADGEPRMKFVLRGLRCYDWRLDSTVAGGSGTHRVDDEATWEWTSNPAICRFNYQLGLKGRLSGRTVLGMGLPTSALHLASYTTAANACDATRTVGARTIATYQVGMLVDTDMDHTEVLRDFDDALAGYTLNASGLSGVIVGAPQTVAHTITADDVRMNASKTLRNRRDTKDLYNHMTGTFMSPEALWNAESLDVVKVNADITADKRERSLPYDFTQVFDPDVAQYLLNIRYRQGRKGGYAMLPVSNRLAFQAEAGDWCTYNSKTWLVMGRRFGDGGYMLELAETGSDVYSETGITAGPVITPPSAPVFFAPTTVSNLTVAPVVVGSDGQSGIRVTWTPPNDPRVDAVILEYRVSGETDVQRVSDPSPEDGEYIISPVVPGEDYEVRATIKTTPARTVQFSSWASVTTATIAADVPNDSVSLSKLGLDVEGILASFQRELDHLVKIVEGSATSGALHQLERFNEDGRIEALVAELEDTSRALVTTESTARADADNALAAQTTLVEAKANDATAQGLFKMEAGASSETGVATELAWFARATTSDTYAEAGLILQANDDGTSSIQMAADKLVMDDGNSPFVFESGTLKLAVANIGTVTSGRLESPDGNTYFDLSQKLLVIG